MAHTPTWDALLRTYSHTQLECSGVIVGLPAEQMGNSEVGHIHLGAGRRLPQDYTRINDALQDGTFYTNPVFRKAVDGAHKNGKSVHIIGLLSPGGVHSHEVHIHAMVELAVQRGLDRVFVHGFLDGRDTPPLSAMDSISAMESKFRKLGKGRMASIVGRFYAMDRDSRWKRVKKAYDLLVLGEGEYRAYYRSVVSGRGAQP